MKVNGVEMYGLMDVTQVQPVNQPALQDNATAEALAELKQSVNTALETYSNVHRGSGHNSLVSTHLYEQARAVVLEYLGLNQDQYSVIFCTPRRAELLKAQLGSKRYQCLSSQDIGLPLGVRALAVERKALPRGIPSQTGGGTARLVSPGWVIWAKAPDKFEAGTPAIVNIIAFARALQLLQPFGKDAFRGEDCQHMPVSAPADILYHDELEQFAGRELLDGLRQTLIGRGVRVPTVEGDRPFVNLDNGASTPTFTPIWEAAWQASRQPRRAQQEIIEAVKSICARALGAPLADYEVIFTSNTTESINLAAESLGRESEPGIKPVVVNTLLEHNSNELPWRRVPDVSLIRLPVNDEGFINLNELDTLLRAYNQEHAHGKKRIKLVAVSGASNVLGIFNNLAEISRIVHHYGARLLVDAAQMVAHRKVEMAGCGIDYLVFSAHKVYAPFGTGVLVVKKGLLHFRPDERALIQSSGEENVAGIAALGKALVLLQRAGLDIIQAEEQALTARALRGLSQISGLTIYGIKDSDSPSFAQKGGVIPFNMGEIMASRIAIELAERGGIGVRAGCHCAHMLIKHLLHIHPLLQLFQGLILTLFPHLALPGVVRVSLGIENREQDIDTLIHVLGEIAQHPPVGVDNPFTSGRSKSAPQTLIQQQMSDFTQAAASRVFYQLK